MTTVDTLSRDAEQLQLPALSGVDATALMALSTQLAGIKRRIEVAEAEVAGEIARRSTRELGYSGLAQREGARTPARLVQKLTGSSLSTARNLVAVGAMLTPDPQVPRGPESVLASAVRAGALTVDQVQAIESGLGKPTEAVTDEMLDRARQELVDLAGRVSVEELRAHAQVLRDELNTAEVADREQRMRGQRFLKLRQRDDGMTSIYGLADPESAARLHAVVDAVLSPRRAGPRFVDPVDVARAEKLEQDPRTNDQVTLDTVVALVEIGAGAPKAGPLVGRFGAPVHLLVAEKDYRTGTGFGRIAGQTAAVSLGTVERAICTDGLVPIIFTETGSLNLGRTQRRFSKKQRMALAARDGCCRKCGRAESQTEAHHIHPWLHGGLTDIDNAILLCRYCHLLIHNNGWAIRRDRYGEFWFTPPQDVDPMQRPVEAHPPDPHPMAEPVEARPHPGAELVEACPHPGG